MSFNKITLSQLKSLPLRKKMLSEWSLPLKNDFESAKINNPKNFDSNELRALILKISQNLQKTNETGLSRVHMYPFLQGVSQKTAKPQNLTDIRSKNASNGAFLHPLSTKHSTPYKKRTQSAEVQNIFELNITSYRNIKIRSPKKKLETKNKKTYTKESILEKKLIVSQKSNRIRVGKSFSKKKYSEGKQLSTISNLKTKQKLPYNTLEIQTKTKSPYLYDMGLTERRNSICPWEDQQNLVGF